MRLDSALKNKIITAIVQYNDINQQLNKYELEARYDDYIEDIETSQSEQILLDGHAVSARFTTVADKYVGPRYEESVSNEKLNNVVYEVNKIDTIVLILCDNGNIVWANRQAKFFVDLQNNYEDNESFFEDEKFSTIELRKMSDYKM